MDKNTIIKKIEEYAPLITQEEWDNSGWQIKLDKEDIKSVLLCVTPTESIIEQARTQQIDLIISHHPLIFPSIKCVDNNFLCKAITYGIQLYSVHTNLDKAMEGTSSCLARELGYNCLEKYNDFIQIATLETPEIMENVLLKTKLTLNLEKIKVLGYKVEKEVKRIAFCAGAGAEFIEDLNSGNIDIYITSDLKYHDEVKSFNYTIFDIGHLESEKPALKKLFEIISDDNIRIFIADEKSDRKYL